MSVKVDYNISRHKVVKEGSILKKLWSLLFGGGKPKPEPVAIEDTDMSIKPDKLSDISNKIKILNRLLEKGATESLAMTFNKDREYLEVVKDFDETRIQAEIKALEKQFYKEYAPLLGG